MHRRQSNCTWITIYIKPIHNILFSFHCQTAHMPNECHTNIIVGRRCRAAGQTKNNNVACVITIAQLDSKSIACDDDEKNMIAHLSNLKHTTRHDTHRLAPEFDVIYYIFTFFDEHKRQHRYPEEEIDKCHNGNWQNNTADCWKWSHVESGDCPTANLCCFFFFFVSFCLYCSMLCVACDDGEHTRD